MKKILFLLIMIILAQGIYALDSADCDYQRAFRYPGDKAYNIEKAFINITINNDGSVDVSEKITFNFYSGKFSFAYRDITITPDKISVLKAYENNNEICYDISGSPSNTKITWYYDEPNNNKRTFEIRYHLNHVIKSYDDYSDFYWKVWGEQWTVGVKDLEGVINFPKQVNDTKEIYSWGHPRIDNSKIGMTNNQHLVFQAFNIPPNSWVEVRTAFPSRLLESKDKTEAYSGVIIDTIIKEEADADKDYANSKIFGWIIILAFMFPFILTIALFLILYYIYGREPDVKYYRDYEQEPPFKYQPAIVNALINQDRKKPNEDVFIAEILYLSRKKYLNFEQMTEKKEYNIKFTNSGLDYKNDAYLTDSQKKVLEMLETYFPKHEFTLEKLEEKVSSDTKSMQYFNEWKEEVKNDIEKLKLLGPNKGLRVFRTYLIVLLVLGFMPLPAFFMSGLFAALLGWILTIAFKQALPARTLAGALHYKRWIAFKNYLKDFTRLKEVPTGAVVLWEDFLIYGMSLGVTKEVLNSISLMFNEKQTQRYLFNAPVSVFTAASFRSISHFSSAVASSVPSSGSRGFSGRGSGGGGGGGGGGAG